MQFTAASTMPPSRSARAVHWPMMLAFSRPASCCSASVSEAAGVGDADVADGCGEVGGGLDMAPVDGATGGKTADCASVGCVLATAACADCVTTTTDGAVLGRTVAGRTVTTGAALDAAT